MTTHGGARPVTRPNDGRKRNKGRTENLKRKAEKLDPSVIRLSKEAQQELRILTLHFRGIRYDSELMPKAIVEEAIHRFWLEYDATVQRHAEELAEVEINEAIVL